MALNLGVPTEVPGETGPHGTKGVQPPPSPEELAKHFPRFEILECLGRGGMGVVYRARQPQLNRVVALKILAPERVAEPKFAERFAREAQALARLSHPNIVTVYDFGETDGLYYLMMEFVDGVTLRQLLREGRMKPEEALAIVPGICEALQFAHEQGVVHRDIKPENVLLDKQGRVKIADFGIAKLAGGTPPTPSLSRSEGERVADRSTEGAALTQDQVLGTPHYMAPEQVEKPQLVDHRADIYSLGVVFYEMLTGELPLGRFQPPSKKVQVDVRLDEVVLHALEKKPERRYQHVSEVKTDVETIAGSPRTGFQEAKTKPPAQGVPPVQSAHGKPADASRGHAIVWGLTLLECGLIGSGFLLDNVPLLLVAAASALIWGIVSAISIALALEKRGLPANYFLIGPLIFKYLPQYRALTLKEAGRVGPLFYSYILAMNLALVAAVVAWVTDRWANAVTFSLVSPARVVAVEEKLRNEIERRLSEDGWKAEGLSVNVGPDLKRAECRFGRLWKGGLTQEPPYRAAVLLEALGGGLWQVRGEGEFRSLRFSVDCATEMAATASVLPQSRASGEVEPLAVLAASFGPIHEVILTELNNRDGQEGLDLDTGTVHQQPRDMDQWSEDGLAQWAQQNGVDLFVDQGPNGVWRLLTTTGAELKLAALGNEKWDLLREGDLARALTNGGPAALQVVDRGVMKIHVPSGEGQPPLTFAFESSREAMGLLQITGFTESPRGVKIRYKLVQAAPTCSATSAALTEGQAFGPVIERELPDPDNGSGRGNREALRLRTGERLSVLDDAPKESGGRLRALVTSEGDLFAEYDDFVSGRWALVTAGLKLSDLLPGHWENATGALVRQTLETPTVVPHQEHSGALLYLLPEGLSPMTFGFRTRHGDTGLLQITGFAENPRAVKLRYKLIQATQPIPIDRDKLRAAIRKLGNATRTTRL